MPDINDGSVTSRPPQISEMFQKFALAFRAKTFELFADEEGGGIGPLDCDGLSLLDHADEVIAGQRVVVIKPDILANSYVDPPLSTSSAPPPLDNVETQVRDFSQFLALLDVCRSYAHLFFQNSFHCYFRCTIFLLLFTKIRMN